MAYDADTQVSGVLISTLHIGNLGAESTQQHDLLERLLRTAHAWWRIEGLASGRSGDVHGEVSVLPWNQLNTDTRSRASRSRSLDRGGPWSLGLNRCSTAWKLARSRSSQRARGGATCDPVRDCTAGRGCDGAKSRTCVILSIRARQRIHAMIFVTRLHTGSSPSALQARPRRTRAGQVIRKSGLSRQYAQSGRMSLGCTYKSDDA